MRRKGAAERTGRQFPLRLIGLLFLCATFAGCDHYCVSFFSNQSAGTVSVNNPTCSLDTKANGMVRVRWSASPENAAASGTIGVQHIFISVRGVEAHTRSVGDEGPSDWLELAPSLAKKPVQIDLMAGSEGSSPSILMAEAAVPSAGYAEVRLLLVPDRPVTGEPPPENSPCTGVGFNCVVTADGSVRPLTLAGGEPQILIPSTRIPGGMFYILPGTTTNLDLELSPYSPVILAPDRSMWLNPVFNVHSEFSLDSGRNADPTIPMNH
jgi:hypothetical protein